MTIIKLDNNFHIEVTNTYDLIENLGVRKDKNGNEVKDKDGNEAMALKNHGYHGKLEQAIYRYSKLVIQNENKEYTLHEYIERLAEIYNSAKDRL